ncbi:hypothetical protein EES39_35350 [Streptomyces sp. ADI92-24]|nr:hypothetical protein EES39_35350 [Streptomyces sp. ADI92-24]
MCLGMLSQALSSPENDSIRDCFRTGSPALIGMFVDIAMVTGKVAPAVNLENYFTERDQGSCHSPSLASPEGVIRQPAAPEE